MFAAIYLSRFPLQAALRLRGAECEKLWVRPAAVFDGRGPKTTICALSAAAENAGIHVGLTSSQALARCEHIHLLSRAPERERAMSAALCDLACSLSLYVEQTAPDVCTLDLRQARIPDLEQWAKNAVTFAARLEMRAQVGIAANPDLALLAARRAAPTLVVGDALAFTSGLPISALSPELHVERVLGDWGIHALGELARLPPDGLTRRLGEEGRRLWNMAQGRTGRLLRLIRPPESFCESFDFEHEIENTEPLLFLLRRFLEQLTFRLGLSYRVAGSMALRLPLANGAVHERAFTIPAPTNDIETLFRILDTHLESLHLDHGPVAMTLSMFPAAAHRQQFGFWGNALRDPNRFSETVARLCAFLGSNHVGVPERVFTHRSDSFTLHPPSFADEPFSNAVTETATLREVVIGLPLRRFRPPFSAQVRLLVHRPAFVVSEKAHGEVIALLGPYRLSGDWWDTESWSVEEWIVELRDGIYGLSCRRGTWLVDGIYEQRVH